MKGTAEISTGTLPPFDLQDLSQAEGLYPAFDFYRRRDPVHLGAPKNPGTSAGCWYVFSHEHALEVLTNDIFRKRASDEPPQPGQSGSNPYSRMINRWMLLKDPPEHGRLRSLLGSAFSSVEVARVRQSVGAIVAEECSRFQQERRTDIVSGFAERIPLRVMAAFMGIPESDLPFIKDSITVVTNAFGGGGCPFHKAELSSTVEELGNYLRARLLHPGSGFISSLSSHSKTHSIDELSSTAAMLLFGGYQSTVHLISATAKSLYEERAQILAYSGEPGVFESLARETLRLESPVQVTYRKASRDYVLGGRQIAGGSDVAVLLGAAGRDPAKFPEPDRCLLHRPSYHPIALGSGRHACPGMHLALMQAGQAARELSTAIPSGSIDSYEWGTSGAFRGLKVLELRY